MSRTQKKLLLVGAAVIVLALIAQRIPMSHKAAIAVGIVEVLLAAATGVAFGITVSKSER